MFPYLSDQLENRMSNEELRNVQGYKTQNLATQDKSPVKNAQSPHWDIYCWLYQ